MMRHHVALVPSRVLPRMAQVLEPQLTTFEHCTALSDRLRVRWTVDPSGGTIDLGLEATLPIGGYAAFGPAAPGAISREMVGSDVVVAGVRGARLGLR